MPFCLGIMADPGRLPDAFDILQAGALTHGNDDRADVYTPFTRANEV